MNEDLCQTIRKVFAGVKLGRGVGLQEAQGLDGHADAATCARYRAKDEKENWSCIPITELNRCYSSLSFFDAEGMRFHLPAFLIAELQGLYTANQVAWTLTSPGLSNDVRFTLLSSAQRSAVRAYLLQAAAEMHPLHHRAFQRALESYWIDPTPSQVHRDA